MAIKKKIKIKRLATIILVAALTLIASPRPAEAAFVLGDKTLDDSGGRKVDIFTQSSTGLTTIQDVFEPQQITGMFTWTLYVHNTGAHALTDLNILINYEDDNWAKAPINLVDAQPTASDWNNACTATLASLAICNVGVAASEPLGWLKVTASAGTTAELTITLLTRDL